MGTVHARVRGPATRGLCDLWAGAAGRRSGGCARGSPGEGAPREAGPGGRRGTGRVGPPAAPPRSAREPRAGEPGRKARPQSCCQRVPQTSEQETQEGRDSPKVTQRGSGPERTSDLSVMSWGRVIRFLFRDLTSLPSAFSGAFSPHRPPPPVCLAQATAGVT